MYPTAHFIYAAAYIIILVAMIVSAISLKKRLDDRGVCVYAQVTHRWDSPGKDLSGFSERIYRVFAKWTDSQTQKTYYFVKESHHPLDYREGDFVPATIDLEHPCFRHLNI